MKSILIFVALLGLALAAPNKAALRPAEDGLREAFAQILENVDLELLFHTIADLEKRDDGVELLEYLRGPDFGAAIDAAKAEPAVEELIVYIETHGFDEVREVIEYIREIIGIPPRGDSPAHWLTQKRSHNNNKAVKPQDFLEVWELLVACVDTENLLATLLNLLSNNQSVVDLIAFIGSDPINDGYMRLKAHPDILAVSQKLRDEGVDVDTLIALLESILGLGPRHKCFDLNC